MLLFGSIKVYLVREVETNQEFAAKVLHKEQVRKDGKVLIFMF